MEYTVGMRIKELRLKARIGLRDFANRIDIPANTLSQIEHDKIIRPNPETIEKIFSLLAFELGGDKDELMLEVGKLPKHVLNKIKKNPKSAADFFRTVSGKESHKK